MYCALYFILIPVNAQFFLFDDLLLYLQSSYVDYYSLYTILIHVKLIFCNISSRRQVGRGRNATFRFDDVNVDDYVLLLSLIHI